VPRTIAFILLSTVARPSFRLGGGFPRLTHAVIAALRRCATQRQSSAIVIRFNRGRQECRCLHVFSLVQFGFWWAWLLGRVAGPSGAEARIHGIVAARLKSCPSQGRRVGGTSICRRLCRTQGPSTALRSGRDDRVCLLCGTAEFPPRAERRFGSVASHLCTERKDGAPLGLVWVGKNLVQRSFVVSLRLCRRLRCLRMTVVVGS
jgi:hypothetical protein